MPYTESKFLEVLLVEDDPAHTMLIRRSLEAAPLDYRLVAVDRLAAAREYLAGHSPQVAIVDLVLPDGRGIDLLPATGDPPRFPTIVLTSQGNERVAVETIKAGALDYVIKSAAVLADMPNIIRNSLRQWQLISEREAARQALAESEERFRQMSEHIRDVFWLYDTTQKKLLYISPAYEAMWGRPREWIFDDPSQWLNAVHEDDRPRVALFVSPTTSGKQFDQMYRIVQPSGAVRWLHDRRFAVCNEAGECFRLAGVLEDITERHAASEKLHEQAMQLAHVARLSTLGELVAGIAHEVNQPLYAIANFAAATASALNAGGELPLAKLRGWNDDILKSAHRAGDIIKRIRAYVSKGPAQRTPVNVNTLVEESVELIAFEARRERVTIGLDLVRPTPRILADPVAIQQVLVNLLRNAFEAQRDTPLFDRAVNVTTQRSGKQFIISVRDNGSGVAPEAMPQLFDTFYTSKAEGMGMGLAISKTIIEAHHGQIGATCNEGRGMTFFVSLPIAPDEAEGQTE